MASLARQITIPELIEPSDDHYDEVPTPPVYPPPASAPTRRVQYNILPSESFGSIPGVGHCPGRVARYTLTILSRGLASLEIQTWSGIYRQFRFWLYNFNMCFVEVKTDGEPFVVLEMKRGSPIRLMFEELQEAVECHDYLFQVTGR